MPEPPLKLPKSALDSVETNIATTIAKERKYATFWQIIRNKVRGIQLGKLKPQ